MKITRRIKANTVSDKKAITASRNFLHIANREAVVNELAEMLKQFDIERNSYQTDVYAYYDEETHMVTLDTFTNVGGNSWLNDDHRTIYTDKEHYEDIFDVYSSIGDIAEDLELSEDELIAKVAAERDLDIEDVDYYEVTAFIQDNSEYLDKLDAYYIEWYVNDQTAEYVQQAEEIIDEYEEHYYDYDEYDY